MIKAAFFAIDGTLISPKYKETLIGTKRALTSLQLSNCKIFIATRRHKEEIKTLPLPTSISFDGYVTLNGQLCYDKDFNSIFTSPISSKDKDVLVKLFNEKKFPMLLFEKNRYYINFINNIVIRAQEASLSPIPDIGEYTGNDIYQCVVYGTKKDIKPILSMSSDCKMTHSNLLTMDIIPASGGKVKGIQYFLDQYDMKPSEIIAFGASENDQEMLSLASISYAMKNSDQETKKCANVVIPSADDDGIHYGLTRYGFIGNL